MSSSNVLISVTTNLLLLEVPIFALLNENIVHFYVPPFKLPHDRLCGLVVRVPTYRSRGPGSILSSTRFSEK
jgi:hypothetical protein